MSQPEMICKCLRVSRKTVEQTVDVLGAETVRDIMRLTEAGTGCMCCRCKIKDLLEARQAAAQTAALEMA